MNGSRAIETGVLQRKEDASDKPILQIIVASTRPGRIGLPVAEWFQSRAAANGGFQLDVVDLAELRLPFLDEPNLPGLRQYENQHTKDWSARVERTDAFVFVLPEYNHGYTAPLKNALDYLHHEWRYKPVGFVSYGGVAAGTRAAEMITNVAVTLKMQPLFEAVSIPFVAQFLDEEGHLTANEIMEKSADAMLVELLRVEGALRCLRRVPVHDGR